VRDRRYKGKSQSSKEEKHWETHNKKVAECPKTVELEIRNLDPRSIYVKWSLTLIVIHIDHHWYNYHDMLLYKYLPAHLHANDFNDTDTQLISGLVPQI
jgi:hypothetical protein